MRKNEYLFPFLSILAALFIGAIIIALIGQNPLQVYLELFKGAFSSELTFGSTIDRFVPILLTALAFLVADKVSAFNVGVEGELYLGALVAAWIGYAISLPKFPHILLCFVAAILAGGLWALIPAILKVNYRVNEICTTILFNYIAILFTSYMVNNPLSSKTGLASTPPVEESALLTRILPPSTANIGLFIAIGVTVVIYVYIYHTPAGYKLRSVGINPEFSECVGINPKKAVLSGMFASGALGGLTGAIIVLGTYGSLLDNFSQGIAYDGMLAVFICKANIVMIPIMSFFLAVLKTGALGMERFTGVEKSLIDTIIAIFILIAAMDGLFKFRRKLRR